MSRKSVIPDQVLEQHIAIVGKTGGGKTITGKDIIEEVYAGGHRVCILDPIKSDWWGLTLAADGKKPGLPFHILGGPYGHVPLHASAAKALGQIVGSGALRHSIIDMADFGPGDLHKFFVPFAEELFRAKQPQTGVLYLVMEEAHVFCPKEREGIAGENLAIFHIKRLASAARSKGFRLICLTQRTQALHNAVLGSCDTLIAHRLTLPADKKPVIDWLKDHADAETLEKIVSSIGSQKKGQAWLHSGEAQITEQIQFPMIKTYDNSATPTGESTGKTVQPPPVDQDKLKAIVGDAVKEAEANDPKLLKVEVQKLRIELKKLQDAKPVPVPVAKVEVKRVEVPVVKAAEVKRLEAAIALKMKVADRIKEHIVALTGVVNDTQQRATDIVKALEAARREGEPAPAARPAPPRPAPRASTPAVQRAPDPRAEGEASNGQLGKAHLSVLRVLAQYPDGVAAGKLALLSGYTYSGGFRNILSELRTAGLMSGENTGTMKITEDGLSKGPFDPLPTGQEFRDYWLKHRAFGKAEKEILTALLEHPDGLTAAQLCEITNKEYSGGFRNNLSVLRTAGVIVGKNTETMRASDEFFQEAGR
jgi:hypothetical protein